MINKPLGRAWDFVVELLEEKGLPKDLGHLVAEYLYSDYEEDSQTRSDLHGVEPYFVMLRVLTALQNGRSPFDIIQDPLKTLTEGIPTKEVVMPKWGEAQIYLTPEEYRILQMEGDPHATRKYHERSEMMIPYFHNESPMLIKLLKENKITRGGLELHRIYDTSALSRVETIEGGGDAFYQQQVIRGVSEEIPWD